MSRGRVSSRVLGVGHLLFDIALEEARNLPVSFACVSGLASPLLIVTVEDEVTGTGALVHRLIFGVTEQQGVVEVLRDWELLQRLNTYSPKSAQHAGTTGMEAQSTVEGLKRAFDADLSSHAPTLHRPTSWSEMLLIPDGQAEETSP